MESSLFNRFQAILLAVATATLIVLAVLNLRQERQFQQPDDGVWWSEVAGGLEAQRVLPGMPGERAGIQTQDLLTDVISGHSEMPITRLSDLDRALYRVGIYGQVDYAITRDGKLRCRC